MAKNLRLKAARAEHDMTQGDLAEAVGATRQTIGLIEAGKYNPSLALCIAICKTLDRTLDQLFGRFREEVKMMKFKLFDYKVMDEREKALNNKVGAECYCIMIAGTFVYFVYGSLFNNGVISADYLLYPLLICSIWSIYRSERLAVNSFGGFEDDSLRLFTGDWLITLIILMKNYRLYHNVYHNNPIWV